MYPFLHFRLPVVALFTWTTHFTIDHTFYMDETFFMDHNFSHGPILLHGPPFFHWQQLLHGTQRLHGQQLYMVQNSCTFYMDLKCYMGHNFYLDNSLHMDYNFTFLCVESLNPNWVSDGPHSPGGGGGWCDVTPRNQKNQNNYKQNLINNNLFVARLEINWKLTGYFYTIYWEIFFTNIIKSNANLTYFHWRQWGSLLPGQRMLDPLLSPPSTPAGQGGPQILFFFVT